MKYKTSLLDKKNFYSELNVEDIVNEEKEFE